MVEEVKKLSGMNVIGGTSDEVVKALRPGDDPSNSNKRDLANEINNAFLAPMSRYAPLSSEPRQHSIQSAQSDTVITVTSNAVFQKLLKLNPKTAHGLDGIPSWLLKRKRRSIGWSDSGYFEQFISRMYPTASLEEGGRSSNTERKAHPGY